MSHSIRATPAKTTTTAKKYTAPVANIFPRDGRLETNQTANPINRAVGVTTANTPITFKSTDLGLTSTPFRSTEEA